MLYDNVYQDDQEVLNQDERELHEMARLGDLNMVKELIRNRVNVNALDEKLRSPLHLAAGQGHNEVIMQLINAGAKINDGDIYGMNALLWAAWFGKIDTMKELIQKGADNSVTNKQGLSVIHCAATRGHVDVLTYLVKEVFKEEGFDDEESVFGSVAGKMSNLLGSSVGLLSSLGRKKDGESSSSVFGGGKVRPETSKFEAKAGKGKKTAFHLTAEQGHIEAIEYLIKAKCNKDAQTGDGSTALHLAAGTGRVEITTKLLEEKLEINALNQDGLTPLHIAAEGGEAEMVKFLLEKGADANITAEKEMAAIHMAARNNHTGVIDVIAQYDSNIDVTCEGGNTALHLAAAMGHLETVQCLVANGATIDSVNQKNQTALHEVTENGFTDIVEFLLVSGAKVHIADKNGKTVLLLAIRAENITVTDMIIKAERYYEGVRKKEIDGRQKVTSFRNERTPQQKQMKPFLYDLAMKELEEDDLKRLFFHWNFKELHIESIQVQYVGNKSWREHAYRMLLIWLHGCDENPLKVLYETLVTAGRKKLADKLRKKANHLARVK